MLLKIRVFHETLGGHVHMGVWSNLVPDDGKEYTLAKCGDLTMSDKEFEVFKTIASTVAVVGSVRVEFVQKRPE